MLKIDSSKKDNVKYIVLEGELDTLSSQNLEDQMDSLLSDTENIVVDLAGVGYITSAGLRILLQMQKDMMKKGTMKIIHVSEDLMEIFEVTGFNEILTIE